jgi:hypothetical protein
VVKKVSFLQLRMVLQFFNSFGRPIEVSVSLRGMRLGVETGISGGEYCHTHQRLPNETAGICCSFSGTHHDPIAPAVEQGLVVRGFGLLFTSYTAIRLEWAVWGEVLDHHRSVVMTSCPVRLLCVGKHPSVLHTRCTVLRHAASWWPESVCRLLAAGVPYRDLLSIHGEWLFFIHTVDNL